FAYRIIEFLSTPKTLSEIKNLTGLSDRCIRYHLKKLKKTGLLIEIRSFSDMRRKIFVLSKGGKNEHP
ncbi:MAG: ArsR family transcriptional regulator, partial [Candidatus Aenigmarchaeota archaeon]|nr:ArsR family transcriptional regulator [Candidatus Aenigmarchaeota archaeon]